MKASTIELATLAVLVIVGAGVLWVSVELKDLRCRLARMETLAVSADPLEECDPVPDRTPREMEASSD